MLARSWRITATAPTQSPLYYRRVHDDNGAGPSRPRKEPKRRARESGRELRRLLPSLDHGVYSTYTGLMRELKKKGFDQRDLSDLERHVILHHIMRRSDRGGPVAVQVASEFMRRTDSTFRERTMDVVCYKKFHTIRKSNKAPIRSTASEQLKPTIEDQRPPDVSPRLAHVLDLLEVMQRRHLRRPKTLYDLVIRQAVGEGRPDVAAKAFVGLVEDWIIEGRIAEGADPEDFYRGGGPPRDEPKSTPLHQLWFSGVRTWRWPGEALSPHDRLDLWHPQHHALHERLRGFPMPVPTSPPSLVPHPSSDLLQLILDALEMDPTKVAPHEYAATMRALAILANTILSRTLPINTIPPLLAKFSQAVMYPLVYPENFTEEPRSNSWAYTANTQVHVALVSLMLSPPNYTQAAEMTEKLTKTQDIKREEGPAQYMLGPLSWRACVVLIKYAAAKLKQPAMVKQVVEYMKSTWADWSPSALNIFFRSSTRSGNYDYAQSADDAFFSGTSLGRRGTRVEDVAAIPNADSVIALIKHLQATKQQQRLVKLTYTLHPFLASAKSETGYARPEVHPLPVYVALVEALGALGQTGLAQRVFQLALHAEKVLVGQFRQEHPGVREPQNVYLPLAMFTALVRMFGAEVGRGRGEDNIRHGWVVPPQDEHLSRTQAAESMILRIHHRVMKRYRLVAAQKNSATPDERYLNAVIRGMRHRWRLEEGENSPLNRTRSSELQAFLRDIKEVGLEPPVGLVSKLTLDIVKGPIEFETHAPFGPTAPIPTSPELVQLALNAIEDERAAHPEADAEAVLAVAEEKAQRAFQQ